MGITVREMLENSFFSDFEVIAGKEGLGNQIQGMAIFDAPDAYKWTREKEFVMTSGYLFEQDINLFNKMLSEHEFIKSACFGIKMRFIKSIPEEVIDKFNEIKMPLIIIPSEVSWMEIINSLNVFIMNKNIRLFNIGNISPNHVTNISYQGRKIHKILSNMEMEYNFPAMVYDVENAVSYYSTYNFKKLSKHMEESDYWDPDFPHTQEILCDKIHMIRYRYHDQALEKPYSWITIPIKINTEIKAYFILVEELGLLDYLDQLSVRIGFLLLQSIYEQVAVLRVVEHRSFEKLVTEIIEGYLSEEDIVKRSNELHLNEVENYYMVIGRSINKDISLYEERVKLNKSFNRTFEHLEGCWYAVLDQHQFILLISDQVCLDKSQTNQGSTYIHKLYDELQMSIPNIELRLGCSDISENIMNTQKNYQRCIQALDMGLHIYPNKKMIGYKELGPFAWMTVDPDELASNKSRIESLLTNKDSDELINTLKLYLRNNMNYSQTAKAMFLHINTVRKRIDEISKLMELDLEDPIERLNLEILLELIY